MGKLQGKVALVTGSGRNIGRATLLHLAREGAHVVVNARSNQAEADAVVGEAQALGVRGDLDHRRHGKEGSGRGNGGEGALRIRPR